MKYEPAKKHTFKVDSNYILLVDSLFYCNYGVGIHSPTTVAVVRSNMTEKYSKIPRIFSDKLLFFKVLQNSIITANNMPFNTYRINAALTVPFIINILGLLNMY